jgi:hypothetical protein
MKLEVPEPEPADGERRHRKRDDQALLRFIANVLGVQATLRIDAPHAGSSRHLDSTISSPAAVK